MMSLYVYEPTVHLFAFSIKEKLFSRHKINRYWIWNKCNRIVENIFYVQNFNIVNQINLEDDNNNLIKYSQKSNSQDGFYEPIFFDNNANIIENYHDWDCHGYIPHTYNSIFALGIDDCYGLGLNFAHPNMAGKRLEVEQLRFLNPENCLILNHQKTDIKEYLGQTLIIAAELSEEDKFKSNLEIKHIANQCLKAIFPNDYYPFYKQSQLFNSHIFEYGTIERKPNQNIDDYQHILVWFFNNKQERAKFCKNYRYFFELFYHRNQIINAFKKVRSQQKLIYKDLNEIDNQIDSLHSHINHENPTEEDLYFLRNKLIKLPKMAREYGKKIGEMYDLQSKTVVEDNSKLYNEKLTECKGNIFNEKDINYLNHFINKTCKYFLDKTEARLKYFVHSSNLVDSAIASVRGQIAIEQTELEIKRQKQDKESRYKQEMAILAIGSGIAAGDIFASSYSLITDKKPLSFFIIPHVHPFFTSIFYSLIWGLIVALFIYFIPNIWKCMRNDLIKKIIITARFLAMRTFQFLGKLIKENYGQRNSSKR